MGDWTEAKARRVFHVDMSKMSAREAAHYVDNLKQKHKDGIGPPPPPDRPLGIPTGPRLGDPFNRPARPPKDRYDFSINIRIQHFIWVCYRMCVTNIMEFINGRSDNKKKE